MKVSNRNVLGLVIIGSLFIAYVTYNIYVTSKKEEAYQAVKSGVIDLNNKWHREEMARQKWFDEQEEMFYAVKYGLSRNQDAYEREHHIRTKAEQKEIEDYVGAKRDVNSTNDVNSTHIFHSANANKKAQNAD